MSFDKKLRALRLKNNMTQEYVAKRMNVARSTIAGYETKGRQPSHEKLAALAGIFHVSVDYLLDGTSEVTLTSSPTPVSPPDDSLLLKKYHLLSADSKHELLKFLHLLELSDKENGYKPL